MAKRRKHLGHQHRMKANAKQLSKSPKKHLRKEDEVHSTDVRDDVGKVVKKPRRETGSETEHKSDNSDGEVNADPYMELVGSFGQRSGSYICSHLRRKWREFKESDSDEDSDSRDDKDGDGNHGKQSQKNVKEQNMQRNKEDRENKMESGVDDVLDETGNSKEDHDRDQGINVDEPETEEANDYRKEDAVANESDNDDDDVGDDDVGDDGDYSDDANKTKSRTSVGTTDPFIDHFQQELEESVEEQLRDRDRWQHKICEIPSLGCTVEVMPPTVISQASNTVTEKTTFLELKVKARLGKAWQTINSTPGRQGLFTPLQRDLFYHMNSYKDLFYSNRTFQNGNEIRRLYCFHAINHIFKTRSRVMKNSAKIVQSWKDKKDIGDQRDQGLTRPKVLILVPFRDAALKVVEVMIQLVCPDGEGHVMNKKRLYDEFSEKEEVQSSRDSRPEDFKQMFTGNIDDCFRLGIAIMKKTLKLYAEFYSADIIVASPLGLRTIIGSLGEKTHEYDFLSSIEVLILDQTDVFLMQNWEHVKHVFDHLHLQPKDAHGVDFSRVRMWCLNGWSKYYRQTLMFSSFISPEINSLFNRNCYNYAGKVKASLPDIPGSICQVAIQVPQAFHRIECSSFTEAADKRFNTFINKILPEFKGSLTGSTAIFVPSYFDFVRLRNYFKREAMECAQISEYSQRSDMQRARTYFQLGKRRFLLFTERFYFFYRYRIKRIKNIIFYELPHYSTFYPEILNFMDTQRSQSNERNAPISCTVLYTKFNVHRLAGVVGTQRCRQMMSSEKHVHMFVTGD